MFIPIVTVKESDCHPVYSALYEQLPDGLRERLAVVLQADSYFIACTATFYTLDGRKFETRLEGSPAWRIPEVFVAHMCLVL